MALEIEGRIVSKLNVQSGTSARGAWEKQEFIVELQEGNFPSNVCMNVWGADKVRDLEKYQVGDRVKIAFNLSSREYNGRWYTDVRAWRIEPAGTADAGMAPMRIVNMMQPMPAGRTPEVRPRCRQPKICRPNSTATMTSRSDSKSARYIQ